jgi:hypothetical protein
MKNIGFMLILIWIVGCTNKLKNIETKDDVLLNNQTESPLESFSSFEEDERQREIFIKELMELDSILQFEDYLDRINQFKPTKLTIKVTNGIISLDFAQLYCKDYGKSINDQKIPNIERLRLNQKLRIYCRDIASDLDVFPKRTGDLSQDCKNYLEAIKKLVSENQEVLKGLTFDDYQKLEESKKITTDSERFLFRKKFLQFLNEKYYVSID